MDFTRALQRMVRRYAGGSAALAARMDMSVTTLSHKASPTYEGQFFSPEEIVQLTDETNDNDSVNKLCEHRGGIFMPMSTALADLTDPELAVVMRETAEFVTAMAKSKTKLSPGGTRTTANELADIEREAAEAIAAIQEAVRRARADHMAAQPAHLRAAA